jgi:hypothetical protein
MRLPQQSAGYGVRVDFGRYVEGSLLYARLGELAGPVKQVAQKLKTAGRTWEDAAEPVQFALAERDAVDRDLDLLAQHVRLALASTGTAAMREEPYTSVFPFGIDYYASAPLDEQESRYSELVERLEAHLPADHPLRLEAVPKLQAGISAFADAEKRVAAARRAQALARTAVDAAAESFDRVLERTYGALIERYGRKAAETYFPRFRRGRAPEVDAGGPVTN